MTTENSEVEIRGTSLLLGGEGLHAERHSPQDLAHVLGSLGREAIIRSIEAHYVQTVEKNPGATVYRPSVRAITLGTGRESVLTEWGQRNRSAVSRSIVELQPHLRDYWNTVQSFDFTPEVRRFGARKTESVTLMLRNPETDPNLVTPLANLPAALGFMEPAATRELRSDMKAALGSGDRPTFLEHIDKLFVEGAAAVDRQTDTYGPETRGAAQIGMIIAIANLNVEVQGEEYLLDPDGYEDALIDAEEYAHQMNFDEVSDMLQMELARIRILRAS